MSMEAEGYWDIEVEDYWNDVGCVYVEAEKEEAGDYRALYICQKQSSHKP
ncbi:hypothetical protein Cs308_0020 [Candidatus Chlamydia sanziniae]|uniref:Uncharacterized protein n=1 Tax=Candidatus Chlamydia sanziniae TaxID=1806891 RepID=A0A1A9HW91_9CHLA|nr:hypothetical protein Cs308_0020 [Candidatus Chlamydia sanziniae]